MIRKLLEFLLSRSLDDGTEPAGWLQRLVQRDSQLAKNNSEVQQLDQLLRSTAATHRQTMAQNATALVPSISATTLPPDRHPSTTATDRKSQKWLVGLAAAAALLILAVPTALRHGTPAVNAGDFSQQLTLVPGEVLRLLSRAAETSQTQVSQLSPLANLTVPEMSNWKNLAINIESPVRQEIDAWQSGWKELKSHLPTTTSQEL